MKGKCFCGDFQGEGRGKGNGLSFGDEKFPQIVHLASLFADHKNKSSVSCLRNNSCVFDSKVWNKLKQLFAKRPVSWEMVLFGAVARKLCQSRWLAISSRFVSVSDILREPIPSKGIGMLSQIICVPPVKRLLSKQMDGGAVLTDLFYQMLHADTSCHQMMPVSSLRRSYLATRPIRVTLKGYGWPLGLDAEKLPCYKRYSSLSSARNTVILQRFRYFRSYSRAITVLCGLISPHHSLHKHFWTHQNCKVERRWDSGQKTQGMPAFDLDRFFAWKKKNCVDSCANIFEGQTFELKEDLQVWTSLVGTMCFSSEMRKKKISDSWRTVSVEGTTFFHVRNKTPWYPRR